MAPRSNGGGHAADASNSTSQRGIQQPKAEPSTNQCFLEAVDPKSILAAEFRRWELLIPRLSSSPIGVDTSAFFTTAWEIVSKNDPDITQQVIARLATEEGLLMIRALTDLLANKARLNAVVLFQKALGPLMQTLSHPMASCLALDTVCGFLFGTDGQQTIEIFGISARALENIFGQDFKSKRVYASNVLTASLQVLQRIITINQTAQLTQSLLDIARRMYNVVPDGCVFPAARKSFFHIIQQLRVGFEASTESENPPIFGIDSSLPGSLSLHGARHDNDHEDISDIMILPTMEEVHAERPQYLPTNNSYLPGMSGLLDRHFRLLREDNVASIREAIRIEQSKLCGVQAPSNRKGRPQEADLRYSLYQQVMLEGLKFDAKGLMLMAGFDQPQPLRTLDAKGRKEWWEKSKRLQGDSLVCLITSEPRIIFFQVYGSYSVGQLTEKLEKKGEPTGSEYRQPVSLFKQEHRASVGLIMVAPCKENIEWVTSQLNGRRTSRLALVEFPGVLLASFEPTLRALQAMSLNLTSIPFSQILPPGRTDTGTGTGTMNLPPPVYAQARGFSFDLRDLTEGKPLYLTPGTPFGQAEMCQMTKLDPTQRTSIINALEHNLAIIQGPPGTGKSYTGVSLIKALLRNRHRANLGPIICVCYTNHALDQLLEHLIDNGVQQVVRIGSRSKSTIIQGLNLRDLSRKVFQSRTDRMTKGQYFKDLEAEKEQIWSLLSRFESRMIGENLQSYLQKNQLHYQDLFGPDMDENGFQRIQAKPQKRVRRWYRGNGPEPQSRRPLSELFEAPLHKMSRDERKRLFNHWMEEINKNLTDELLHHLSFYQEIKNKINKYHRDVDIRCLTQAQVIGITTSGLARNIDMLRLVPAKVLVCEEAGEVLEAQTLTALLPSIEHAILIGDHQQLRPQIHTYELQHDHPSGKRYSLDVSLFERLINPETGNAKLPFSTLSTQRRMHPSVAELVRTTIYPQLEDHPSVSEYPNVVGMRDRLFWLDHRKTEDIPDQENPIATSKMNYFEVEMVNALVSHLVRQGAYKREDIAVLTPYLGQLQKLREKLQETQEIFISDMDLDDLNTEGFFQGSPEEKGVQRTPLVNAIRLATVDNFQGEEAKVIIISLVRSNEKGRCGFLKTTNRINVLLSRAKHGMYIIGNAETASSVPMWEQVISILKRDNRVGPQFSLCCQRHPEIPIEVSTAEHFANLSPEGGCCQRCDKRLACGHQCFNKCHSETLHNAVRCLQNCPRLRKTCSHPCPGLCGDPCEEKCRARVTGVTLKCGHTPQSLQCYQTRALDSYCCQVRIKMTAPICGHNVTVPCEKTPLDESYKCRARCGKPLPCGHNCTNVCSDCRTKGDGNEVVHGQCKMPHGNDENNLKPDQADKLEEQLATLDIAKV